MVGFSPGMWHQSNTPRVVGTGYDNMCIDDYLYCFNFCGCVGAMMNKWKYETPRVGNWKLAIFFNGKNIFAGVFLNLEEDEDCKELLIGLGVITINFIRYSRRK